MKKPLRYKLLVTWTHPYDGMEIHVDDFPDEDGNSLPIRKIYAMLKKEVMETPPKLLFKLEAIP